MYISVENHSMYWFFEYILLYTYENISSFWHIPQQTVGKSIFNQLWGCGFSEESREWKVDALYSKIIYQEDLVLL